MSKIESWITAEAKRKGFEIIKGFCGQNISMRFRHRCPDEKEVSWLKVPKHAYKYKKLKCPNCDRSNQRKPLKWYRERVQKNLVILLPDGVGWGDFWPVGKDLEFRCYDCNSVFSSDLHSTCGKRKSGCPSCKGKVEHSEVSAREAAEKQGLNLTHFKKEKGVALGRFTCPRHGELHGWRQIAAVKYGNSSCMKCGRERAALKTRTPYDDFVESISRKGFIPDFSEKWYRLLVGDNSKTRYAVKCKKKAHKRDFLKSNIETLSCLECNPTDESTGERICRDLFKRLTKRDFKKYRRYLVVSDDLLNRVSADRRPECSLDLDGYCEDLAIAFEFHGQQHFKHVSHFHKTELEFFRQQARDYLKKYECERRKIDLIVISYKVPAEDIEAVIRRELELRGFRWKAGRYTR